LPSRSVVGMPGGHPHAQIFAEEDRLFGAGLCIQRIRVLLHFLRLGYELRLHRGFLLVAVLEHPDQAAFEGGVVEGRPLAPGPHGIGDLRLRADPLQG
jgi:hypothetical protein